MLPKTLVDEEGLKEGEEVEVTVRKTSDVHLLRGKYPFKNLQHENEKRNAAGNDLQKTKRFFYDSYAILVYLSDNSTYRFFFRRK